MNLIWIIHIFTSFFMTGLCWFTQIVHYPLFRFIDPKDFPTYERKNLSTAFITVPVMIVELLTGLWLLYINQSYLHILNVALLGFIGLSTVIFQGPIHLKLTNQTSSILITKLIQTNWIRTVSWSLRSFLLMYSMTF